MRIAFILLAHEPAEHVLRLARLLVAADRDCQVVIHYDRNAPDAEFARLTAASTDESRIHCVPDRVACGWGQFGLVDGVVRAMRLIRDRDIPCDREMLISGSCLPVRPLAQLKRYLTELPEREFIQCQDERWILGGLREERWQYRHYFSHRTHPKLHHWALMLQRALGVKRRFPRGLAPRYGSQWWCLTRRTCDAVLNWIDKNPADYRFFRTVWIPDETCIQSIVHSLVPEFAIANHNLTFYTFSEWGKPVIYLDCHLDYLLGLNYFFARKIAPEASSLGRELAQRAAAPDDGVPLDDIGIPDEGYAVEVRRRWRAVRPGQLFSADQLAGQWPGPLGKCHRFVAILYGPPAITRGAAATLRGAPGLTVLGRLFHPKRVDFGDAVKALDGLRSEDVAIRDMDPALYLARAIERTKGLTVIELAPTDNIPLTWKLLDLESAIFVPFAPSVPLDDDSERLFFALSLMEHQALENEALGVIGPGAPRWHLGVRREIDGILEQMLLSGDRTGIRERILRPGSHPRQLPVEFGDFGRDSLDQATIVQNDKVLRASGGEALPLLQALPGLRAASAKQSPHELLAPLPPGWRDYFLSTYAIDGVRGRPTLVHDSSL